MTGIDIGQLKANVIVPVLARFPAQWNSEAALNLVAGTALAESGGMYVKQLGDGPALGLWQMEPATHDDCYTNYLDFPAQAALKAAVTGLLAPGIDQLTNLTANLFYAAAMCRVRYIRAPGALPAATDAAGMAAYHKQFYNSALGAADATKNEPLFQEGIEA